MSIKTEIVRITTNVSNAYNAAEQNGATMPSIKNSANLASTVQQLVKPTGVLEITENNTYDVTTYASVEVNVESGPSGEYNIEQVTLDDGTCELKITDAAGGSGGGIDAAELGVFSVDLEKYPNFPVGGSYTYYHKLSNDKFLYSTSVSNGGVWLCNRKTGEVEQLWSTGYLNGNFFTLSNGDIITPLSAAGILYYHKKTKTFEQLDTTAKNIDYFEEQWNGDVFMTSWNNNGSAGLRWYSAETHTITKVPSSSLNYCNGVVLKNGNILFGGRQMTGIYLYSKETNTSTQIDSTLIADRFMLLDNGNVLFACDYSTKTGLYLYSAQDGTITTITTYGYDWRYIYKMYDGKYLISGSNDNLKGLQIYNPSDNTLTATPITSYYYNRLIQLPDDTFMCLGSSYSVGTYIYDYTTNTVAHTFWNIPKPTTNGGEIIQYENGDMFIFGDGSNYYGYMTYFSFENKTMTQLATTGKHINQFSVKKLSNGNVEMNGRVGNTSWLFDYETKTVKKINATFVMNR